jgi:hypothetical protein
LLSSPVLHLDAIFTKNSSSRRNFLTDKAYRFQSEQFAYLRWVTSFASKHKHPGFMKIHAPALLICLLILAACGGGGNGSAASASDLSGNWQMVLQLSPTSSKTESGFILQSGDSLTGSVLLSGQTLCPGLGSALGQVTGGNVAITVSQIAQTVSLTGTATNGGSSMAGNYSILTNGCGGSTIGTWTADRVKPLKGTYQGTFTSTKVSGRAYDVSATVTQGPNTGASNASLSGTITSPNATCFSTLSLSGVIGGTSFVFNFLAPDGSAVGQYRATLTTDATKLTGSYDFLAQDNVCFGDTGLATMSLQQ